MKAFLHSPAELGFAGENLSLQPWHSFLLEGLVRLRSSAPLLRFLLCGHGGASGCFVGGARQQCFGLVA